MKKLLFFLFFTNFILLGKAQSPQLSFFNEMEGVPLEQLFKDTSIIRDLSKLNAQIRMGILDTSSERVKVIKQLNNAKIPVVAWLLLSKEKGYWFHSKNGNAAIERYHEIKQWAQNNHIEFSGIGLDLELDMNDIDLAKNHKTTLFTKIIKRLYDKEQVIIGKKIYQSLIDEIRQDGYKVESYYVPFIRFENEKGRTALQQVSGFLDIKTDNDIPMLYSSFMGDNGYGLLNILAKNEGVKSVAIGSTGGGFDTTMHKMTWSNFIKDISIASTFAKEIHIFSLEGAVQNGFLNKLTTTKWNQNTAINKEKELNTVLKLKSIVLNISLILSYPTILLFVIISLIILITFGVYFIIKKVVHLISNRR